MHVLVDGALVNIAGLDGNPIEIMDLSFSVQALAVHYLRLRARSPVGVAAGSRTKLDDLIRSHEACDARCRLDAPTEAQLRFRDQWAVGAGNGVASSG